MWVLDYERDLDADFLGIYGIDLEVDTISGPRYLALATRVTAYSGVMSARRSQAEDEGTDQAPATSGERRTEVAAMRFTHPDLISIAEV